VGVGRNLLSLPQLVLAVLGKRGNGGFVGILALVAQFFYWADIVKKLNARLVEGSGHSGIRFVQADSGRDEFLTTPGQIPGAYSTELLPVLRGPEFRLPYPSGISRAKLSPS